MTKRKQLLTPLKMPWGHRYVDHLEARLIYANYSGYIDSPSYAVQLSLTMSLQGK